MYQKPRHLFAINDFLTQHLYEHILHFTYVGVYLLESTETPAFI